MKIYRAWSDSMHKIQYTYGYYESSDDAWAVINEIRKDTMGASDPSFGVEEIEVYPKSKDIKEKE